LDIFLIDEQVIRDKKFLDQKEHALKKSMGRCCRQEKIQGILFYAAYLDSVRKSQAGLLQRLQDC